MRPFSQRRHLAPDSLATPASLVAGLPRRAWIVLAIIGGIVWFANLDVRKLQHPDEGRYAEIAREMVASGDWITPRLDGIKYFEKPPLQYWLTAASFRAFELDEWTARLPSALAGFLTILVVGYVGWRVASPTTGVYAATVLAGCVWPFGIAHMVTLDALLTFWLAVVLGAFLLAERETSVARRRAWMLAAWAAAAGGMLTKGLIALVIPFCTLLLHSLARRDWRPWSRLELARGLALFLVLAAPWFIVVSLRNAEFARFFFVHEHFERFLTQEHRRTGAWWYFVPLLAMGLLPWTGIFLLALPRSWREAARPSAPAWTRFCLIWSAFVLVFFSLSGSKLPSYILPMFPALALVLGQQLERMAPRMLARLVALLAMLTTALLLASIAGWSTLAARLADPRTPRALYDALGPWIMLALGIAAASYVGAWIALRRNTERGKSVGIVIMSLGTILALQAAYTGSDVFRATRSAADIVTVLENTRDPPYDRNAPFFQVRMYDQTLPFYLGRTTTLVQYRDELAPGLDAEPALAIAHERDWLDQWESLPQGYALMAHDTQQELASAGIPMRVIVTGLRSVLVARR
jgi:4-amino-4-deoxy-L-arabinose transferase-like glycosyltransferase